MEAFTWNPFSMMTGGGTYNDATASHPSGGGVNVRIASASCISGYGMRYLAEMNKYENLKNGLDRGLEPSIKCFGNSMLPILTNPSTCKYRRQDAYRIGDIVFCRVRGRYIDAHRITAIDGGRYLISNNHGHNNGWTRTVYGRVVEAVLSDGTVKSF